MLSPDQRVRTLEAYRSAVRFIDRDIVRMTPRRRSPEGKVRAALQFNRALGDPQRAYPSVQVAGTSGKGSVCQLIAATLSAAGLRTGCHTSPYLQAFTEKTWIDGSYCSVGQLVAAVDGVRPTAEAYAADDDCPASVHGMASLAVSYLAFREARLDVAVMETGLGGRFDLVQGLERELSVITELGLDHTTSLGPTLDEIAWHKAGIIERGVPCVASRGRGWAVLEAEARAVGAPLIAVDTGSLRPRSDGSLGLSLDFLGRVDLELGTRAPFAARNAALAAAALDRLAAAGWAIEPGHLRAGFRSRLPGRLERVAERPRIVLDCAHNAQKVAALRTALGADGLTVIFAATGSRSPEGLLEELAGSTAGLVATELDLYGKACVAAEEIAASGTALGIAAEAIAEPRAALERAIDLTPAGGVLLITGSVYLVGLLRDRWYPTDEVVLQRTSWPVPAPSAAPA